MMPKKPENDEIPEIPSNPLEEELNKPLRKRKGHPSHTTYHRLSATEEKGVAIAFGRRKFKRKAKKFDGRALSHSRPRIDKVLRSFYEKVDLPKFKEALAFSKDPKFHMLMNALGNPRLARCTFAELCRRCELGIIDLANMWRDYQRSLGMLRMMEHMPQVMEDVAVDSKSRVVPCARCDGKGKLENEMVNKRMGAVCPDCHGDGKIRILGDKDARVLAFEAAGLKKGVPQTPVQINVGMPAMEDLVADAEKALEIQATEVIDGRIAEDAAGAGDGAAEADRQEAGTLGVLAGQAASEDDGGDAA